LSQQLIKNNEDIEVVSSIDNECDVFFIDEDESLLKNIFAQNKSASLVLFSQKIHVSDIADVVIKKPFSLASFLTDIKNCDYHKYTDINMQETILFCWLTKQLSENRWNLLLVGIKDAIKIRKNIFQKFLIQSKDILRKVILKIKGENKHD
jgi:hypothetical protein